jgi:hypothetical protein
MAFRTKACVAGYCVLGMMPYAEQAHAVSSIRDWMVVQILGIAWAAY